MTEGFPRIQVSRMFNKDQIVVRGDSPDEVAELADGLAKASERIASALNATGQVVFAVNTFKGDGESTESKPRSSGSSSDPKKSCDHGEMEYRTGKKANGDTWTAHFCPDKKCEVQWGKTIKAK